MSMPGVNSSWQLKNNLQLSVAYVMIRITKKSHGWNFFLKISASGNCNASISNPSYI